MSTSAESAHLVRDGQQSFVQLLHQLFERWSLGGNSMPTFAHQHVPAGERAKCHHITTFIAINMA